MFIRQALPEDADTLQLLGFKTFYDTFATQNKAEDMKMFLSENYSISRIQDELHHPGSFFYLAYLGEKAAGYVKLSHNKPEGITDNCLEIERIYVDQMYHGQKIGAALMEKCIAEALKQKKKYIWLGVWEKNNKAINFYKKWGFEIFGVHKFKLGNDLQDDVLMKKALVC